MSTKQCTKCKVVKPWSEFGLRKERNNRPRSKCRECEKVLCKAWQAKNVEKKKAYSKAYHASERGRAIRRRGYSRFIKSNSEKAIAYNKRRRAKQIQSGEYEAQKSVQRALNSGIIFKKNICASCFKEGIRTGFHHYVSYRPENHLDVVELCYTCHYEAHHEADHDYYPRYMEDKSHSLPL